MLINGRWTLRPDIGRGGNVRGLRRWSSNWRRSIGFATRRRADGQGLQERAGIFVPLLSPVRPIGWSPGRSWKMYVSFARTPTSRQIVASTCAVSSRIRRQKSVPPPFRPDHVGGHFPSGKERPGIAHEENQAIFTVLPGQLRALWYVRHVLVGLSGCFRFVPPPTFNDPGGGTTDTRTPPCSPTLNKAAAKFVRRRASKRHSREWLGPALKLVYPTAILWYTGLAAYDHGSLGKHSVEHVHSHGLSYPHLP